MPKNKSLKQILLRKTTEFLKHSTLHGLYYFHDSTSGWVYVFWSITLASCIGLCGFLSHMIWDKFITDPTFTVVETTHYPTGKIPFPAVSVCDSEMVYGPSTNSVKEILRLRGFDSDEINDFFRSITDIKLKDYVVTPHVIKIHNVLESLGYTYHILLDLLKKPCDKLIEECVWRAKSINCTKMFRPRLTYVGYCCQFDLTYFRSQAEPITNFAASTDITEGLDITINTDTLDSNGLHTDGYASVYVFDETNDVTILDSAILVTPATYFDVTLTVWLIESSPDAKALSLENRKCYLHTDSNSGASSYQNCIMNLVMRKVAEQCRCLPFNYDYETLEVEDIPACSWSRLECVYETLDNFQGNVRGVVSYNECYQNCDYVQYETEVEYLKQDRAIIRGKTLNSRVTVHFEDSSCMKYKREVLYTWDQMLANLGGIFGLCLGGSVISIIEFVWFIADVMKTCFVNTRSGGVPPRRPTNNKVFVVSKNENDKRATNKQDVTRKIKFLH